ncbi:unnamed protein product [Vicia faba]|uniref:Uncharacterized protein n=1 Tax=Vicia faba TaxID=3906 RepID=A0AAV0YAX0_VICFA|nr:unnamed protein product [Vicia faba]
MGNGQDSQYISANFGAKVASLSMSKQNSDKLENFQGLKINWENKLSIVTFSMLSKSGGTVSPQKETKIASTHYLIQLHYIISLHKSLCRRPLRNILVFSPFLFLLPPLYVQTKY